jgi:ABC-2 type transport system ATP-binding protein
MIEISALNKAFGHSEAIKDLTLHVPGGQVLGLVGPNGSGKTTILRILAGLLAPDSGSIYLNGSDLLSERDRALEQVRALVQGKQLVDGQLTVEEHIWGAADGEHLLRQMGLWGQRGDPASCLSHGLRRRIALISVLAARAPITLLDEPTTCLDERGTRAITAWVRDISGNENRAVIIATARPQLASEFCDRAAVIKGGRLAADVPINRSLRLGQATFYQIKVKGALDERWSTWFEGLDVICSQDETIISGVVVDQPALHSLLTRVRDLGLPLVSVNRIEPATEELLG